MTEHRADPARDIAWQEFLKTQAMLTNTTLNVAFDAFATAWEARSSRETGAPQPLPCTCSTYCRSNGYPDAPLPRGYFCRERQSKKAKPQRTEKCFPDCVDDCVCDRYPEVPAQSE